MYRTIVNPGFVGKASHALTVCCGPGAPPYIEECFERPDRSNRLYDIRNAINHGSVDAENMHELARIDERLRVRWLIVCRIFGPLVHFSYPVDTPPPQATSPEATT